MTDAGRHDGQRDAESRSGGGARSDGRDGVGRGRSLPDRARDLLVELGRRLGEGVDDALGALFPPAPALVPVRGSRRR